MSTETKKMTLADEMRDHAEQVGLMSLAATTGTDDGVAAHRAAFLLRRAAAALEEKDKAIRTALSWVDRYAIGTEDIHGQRVLRAALRAGEGA